MFLDNKYTRWYYTIVNKRLQQETIGYTEKHHIIPKSLGGSDLPENLVSLTPREHFLLHWLLIKMCEGEDRKKMCFALYSISWSKKSTNRILSGWQYEKAKRAKSLGMIGENNPIHFRDIHGKNNPFFGKTHTEETKQKISAKQKERLIDPLLREAHGRKMKGKLAGVNHPFYGKPGPSTNKTWNVKLETCPHCGYTGGANNMKRWHFDNCKSITKF